MEPEMKRAASQPTMIIMCVAARKGQQKHKARERERAPAYLTDCWEQSG